MSPFGVMVPVCGSTWRAQYIQQDAAPVAFPQGSVCTIPALITPWCLPSIQPTTKRRMIVRMMADLK